MRAGAGMHALTKGLSLLDSREERTTGLVQVCVRRHGQDAVPQLQPELNIDVAYCRSEASQYTDGCHFQRQRDSRTVQRGHNWQHKGFARFARLSWKLGVMSII